MRPIGRTNDDFRERLTLDQIHAACARHGLPKPTRVEPEHRGNEKVIYYLDDRYALQFMAVQGDVDALRLLSHIEEIPTAQVLGWFEEDPDVGASCLITTRCPGTRLDALWKTADEAEKPRILYGLGASIAGYNTASPDTAVSIAMDQGRADLVRDQRSRPLTAVQGRRTRARNRIEHIGALLRAVDDRPGELLEALQHHLETAEEAVFLRHGITHPEPWVEHYIVDRTEDGYVLSGCVDVEWLLISDPGFELAVLYAAILAHDERWWNAFAEGYASRSSLPDGAKQMLHRLAIDFDAWSLSSSAGDADWVNGKAIDGGKEVTPWRLHCGKGHARRLRGLLGLDKDFTEILFRSDIGPW